MVVRGEGCIGEVYGVLGKTPPGRGGGLRLENCQEV